MNKKRNQLFQHVNSQLQEVLKIYTDGMTIYWIENQTWTSRNYQKIIPIRSNGDDKPKVYLKTAIELLADYGMDAEEKIEKMF